jgi:hypothetical protein
MSLCNFAIFAKLVEGILLGTLLIRGELLSFASGPGDAVLMKVNGAVSVLSDDVVLIMCSCRCECAVVSIARYGCSCVFVVAAVKPKFWILWERYCKVMSGIDNFYRASTSLSWKRHRLTKVRTIVFHGSFQGYHA